MSSDIFVSYRREDEPWAALSIANALRNEIGRKRVFMDVDMGMGQTFSDILRREVDQCKVMIIIVGHRWNPVDERTNNRRLLEKNDWVRREIELALSGRKLIFLIRIGDALLPQADEMPPSLHHLLDQQDYNLSEPRYFSREMGSVIDQLKRTIGSRKTWLDRIPFRGENSEVSETTDPVISTVRNGELFEYDHVPGNWHEYHITFDPIIKSRTIAHATLEFKLDQKLNITGSGHFPTQNRKVLHYTYGGSIRGGNMFYTAVCREDSSDAYCVLFSNLWDNQIIGSIVGLDYDKRRFASPVLLSKRELPMDQVTTLLKSSLPQYFSDL